MKILHFDINPQNFIRMLIELIYEENIDEYNQSDMDLTKLKFLTYDFIFTIGHLTDDFIDKICSELTNDDTLEIENTNEFRYNLWKALINSKEYIDYISDEPMLNSGVFDKKHNREYGADFGEHWVAIKSALIDANIPEDEYDNYINTNLYLYGENFNNSNVLQNDTPPLRDDEKIESLNKKQLVNEYQEKYWIESD